MAVIKVFFLFFLVYAISGLKLEQVLILGRHNIRAPLTKKLEDFSPRTWPKWDVEAGNLTPKGMLLEENMGKYISEWLQNKNILPVGCPTHENTVFIYANTRQRTRESAKAFVNGAFKNCNISVFSIDSVEMDPTFNPILLNPSKSLKDIIIQEMTEKIDNLHLSEVYKELDKILNINESSICRTRGFCSFVDKKDNIFYEIGEEPNIKGPLRYSNEVIDSFLMAYYEGMPIGRVAWGRVTSLKQWNSISRIAKENLNVRFNTTTLAKEVAKPLLQYIYNILANNTHKLTLLAGHDSNLMSVTTALDFDQFELPEQFEPIPLGSKLIFQKWYDDINEKSFLKIHFVYQTPQQLRDGAVISNENRPQWIEMRLKLCRTDDCSWDVFINVLKNLVN